MSNLLFSCQKKEAVISEAPEPQVNLDMVKKCQQLEGEVIFWMQQLQTSREMLAMEQSNSRRWENECYQVKVELLEKDKHISELEERANQLEGDIDCIDNKSRFIRK